MKHKIVAHNMWSFPTFRFPFSLLEEGEEEDVLQHFNETSGLTIAEDEQNIYIEAAVPGIKPEEIEMTFENGALWINAVKKEEVEDKKKYYRRAMRSFSYRIAIPADVDETKQPEAVCKNGILKVTFVKRSKNGPKKISIKNG